MDALYQLSYSGVVLREGFDSKNESVKKRPLKAVVLEVGLEPTKREAREIYSLLSLPLDDSSVS